MVMYLLRHTTASDFLMGGGSMKTVADLLGTSTRMLDTRYAHLSRDFLANEVANLGVKRRKV